MGGRDSKTVIDTIPKKSLHRAIFQKNPLPYTLYMVYTFQTDAICMVGCCVSNQSCVIRVGK